MSPSAATPLPLRETELTVESPYDRTVVGRVPRQSSAEAGAAIARAASYDHRLTAWERYAILDRFCDALEDDAEPIARLIARESGKTIRDCRVEVKRSYQTFLLSAEEAKRINGELLPLDAVPGPAPGFGAVFREPLGVIAAITPFNFPLNLVAHKVGPAIAANNAVVLKPSSHTPLTALRMAELLYQAGLPTEMLQVVTGAASEIGDVLVTHPAVDKVTFTGSTEVGHQILERMRGLKSSSMELGGNDPLILLADADSDWALPIAIDGALGTNGERCTSVKRIIIDSSIADEFIDRYTIAARAMVVGDPLDERSDVGPLITESAAREVEARVNAAVEAGATLRCGGRREGALLWPAVLDHVSQDDPLVVEETFGPVAPFIRVADFEEAIAVANATEFGLQAGIFTADLDRAMAASRRIEAGAVIINNAPGFRAEHLPFGGVKGSGIGREGVRYAVEAMTRPKMMVIGSI